MDGRSHQPGPQPNRTPPACRLLLSSGCIPRPAGRAGGGDNILHMVLELLHGGVSGMNIDNWIVYVRVGVLVDVLWLC